MFRTFWDIIFLVKNEVFTVILDSVTYNPLFYKKIPSRRFGMGFFRELLRSCFLVDIAVHLANDRLFPNLPAREGSYSVSSVPELVGYTSLEEHLLVSEDELLV